jgi:RNA polymerase I-specific transcription initiation factor RRN7
VHRGQQQFISLSATLYRLTKRLSTVLSLPLTLHHSLAPRLQRIKAQDPESHKYDNVAPELAFVATGIIALKMVYGLDGEPRLVAILSTT